MGSQIAQLLSRVGKYSVVLVDVSDDIVGKALKFIEAYLRKYFVEKGKMTEGEMEEVLSRIREVLVLRRQLKTRTL